MIGRLGLAAALGLAASAATALTCLPPDAARAYISARDSADRHIVVDGTFVPDDRRPRRIERGDGGQVWTGTFRGRSLAGRGFTEPFSQRIEWRAACIASWCAGPPPADRVLAFINLSGRRPAVETSACGGGFVAATRRNVATLTRCHRGEGCRPAR